MTYVADGAFLIAFLESTGNSASEMESDFSVAKIQSAGIFQENETQIYPVACIVSYTCNFVALFKFAVKLA